MRNTSRRRIRSSVPQTNFWIETKSMSANYYIPNMSYNPNYPKRIKFADGSTIVTTDVKVDFSQKEGVKRIEYVEILNLSNLTSYLYAPDYYMQGRENVQKMIDTFNLEKGKDYSIYVNTEYNYTVTQRTRLKKDYQITDFKKDTTNGRIYHVEEQHLSDFTLDENYKKLSINTNKEHLDFTFKGNTNTKHLDLRYIPALTWNLTNKESISLDYAFIYNIKFKNLNRLDLPVSTKGSYRVESTNLQDVELYPCKAITLSNNAHFENKNKLIPQVENLIVDSSSYKSIQLEHPEDLTHLTVGNGIRKNYGNKFKGTDVLNITECLNLETLGLENNPTLLDRISDFSIFTKLKTLGVSGVQTRGETKKVTLPPQLENLELQEFAYGGLIVDLNEAHALKSLGIGYMDNIRSRITKSNLSQIKSFTTRFCQWDTEYLTEFIKEIADNPIHGGNFWIECYQYNDVSLANEEVAALVEQCKRLKQKGWTMHTASNKIILNNI